MKDKSSLAAVQRTLNSVLDELKVVDGVSSMQRIVCGGVSFLKMRSLSLYESRIFSPLQCLDYKVVVALPAEKFGAWEQKKFAPEEKFLAAVSAIPGVTQVETQTYTLMPIS